MQKVNLKLNWDGIGNIGLKAMPGGDYHHIQVFNRVLAITLITYFAFIPVSGMVGSWTYFLILLSSILLILSCFLLNLKQQFSFSKLLFVVVLIASISLISAHLGLKSGIFFCLIPISTLPLLFYRRAWIAFFPFFIALSSFFLLQYDLFQFHRLDALDWQLALICDLILFGVLLVGFLYNAFFKVSAEEKDEKLIRQSDEISKRNRVLMENIDLARNIQVNLLPFDSFFKSLFPDSFIFYRPKDIVSGDFYWVEAKGRLTYCAAIDCTGHGVPGAFMSILGHQGLSRCINEMDLKEPSDILNKLHEILFSVLRKEDNSMLDGMDMSLISIDMQNGLLKYSGAHNSLLIARSNEFTFPEYDPEYRGIAHSIYKLPGQRQSVGSEHLMEEFEQVEISLRNGDGIYLYTDGYVDQFGGPHKKKLMQKQFKKLLLSLQELSMDRQKEEVEQYFENWKGDGPQIDDICVLGLKHNMLRAVVE